MAAIRSAATGRCDRSIATGSSLSPVRTRIRDAGNADALRCRMTGAAGYPEFYPRLYELERLERLEEAA
jgi:hypothetical protein